MKKNKLLLINLVVGIIALGISFFIKSQAVTETKRLGDPRQYRGQQIPLNS